MADVDPFIQPIPEVFSRDRELRAYYEYLHRWLHDMWVRTGSGDDAIDSAAIEEKYPWQLSPLQTAFNAVSASSNYTANDFDFINASGGITITLPEYPMDNSVVIVRNGDGSGLTIGGNGRNINGQSSAVLRSKYSAITFQYFINDNEWFPR